MTDVILTDTVLDGGLEVLNTLANAIWVCDGTPTDFADAEAKELGFRTFTVGTVFGDPANASPDGRQVTSVPVTDGTVNHTGTVTCWAVVDIPNSKLLAVGNLTGGMAVTSGWAWTLDAFTIRMPAEPGIVYAGPGDVAAATAWWGLRAYTADYAAAQGPCIDIVKTSDGSATMTINVTTAGHLDVATIAALGYGVSVSKIYDQVGTSHLTQSTLSQMPVLGLSVFGSLPALQCVVGSNRQLGNSSTATLSQPFSTSYVARRTSNTSALNTVICFQAANILVGFNDSSGSVYMYAGSLPTASATENALHSVHNVFDNTSSSFVVDGGTASTVIAGATSITGLTPIMGSDLSSRALTGEICEAGIWPAAFSSGEQTALAANEKTYWGIS